MIKYLFAIIIIIPFSIFANEKHEHKKEPIKYIIGGNNDIYSKWQVKLDINIGGIIYNCGGSIINRHWILTASHCLIHNNRDATAINITTIDNDTYKTNVFYLHHKYDSVDNAYDIALIYVESGFNRGANILLSDVNETKDAFLEFDNYWNPNGDSIPNLYVSGYGYTDINKKIKSDILQSVLLSGLPKYECTDQIDNNYTASSYNVICAVSPSNEIKDSCNGDSGGSVVWQNKNNINDQDYGLRLIAVTSWGDEHCQGFGVYTQVSSYIDWINFTISEHNGVKYNVLNEKSINLENNPFDINPKDKDKDKDKVGSGGSINYSILLILFVFFSYRFYKK